MIKTTVTQDQSKQRNHIYIHKPDRQFFPKPHTSFTLINNTGHKYQVHLDNDYRITGLSQFFESHSEIIHGTQILIKTESPNRTYTINFVNDQVNGIKDIALRLVENWSQVEANIQSLESALESADKQRRDLCRSLIKRGTCFVAYLSKSGPAFAPSKFIGYANNDLFLHVKKRKKLDGRETNKSLQGIIGFSPSQDIAADKAYVDFCNRLQIVPAKSGNFGAPRRFWVLDELVDYFEDGEVKVIQNDSTLSETEKEQLVKARIGQGLFRKDLLKYWDECCCLTGCHFFSVLKASHIKPWSKCDKKERLDKFNGLLLSPNADALFDQGYISISDEGELLVSPQLSGESVNSLLRGCKSKIPIKDAHKKYLAFHRDHCFRSDAQPGR